MTAVEVTNQIASLPAGCPIVSMLGEVYVWTSKCMVQCEIGLLKRVTLQRLRTRLRNPTPPMNIEPWN
ncbi:hypothetical protein ACN42_g9923 [Penicillium freii]|uniref:Uncharacterized protein n=1 Tax=Penicillium freii TaxID=48697 RepID=A0A101MB28_PENFR|nr:hypothetical protein ACN42_g9923 [Penicillium freii]